MTTQELLDLMRLKLDDTVEPYGVSDVDIIDALSKAQGEFAKLTYSNYMVVTAPITSGDPWVTIPSNLILVRTVILVGKQVRPVFHYEMDWGYFSPDGGVSSSERWTDWREATGIPRFAIKDMGPDKLRLYPIPDADDTAGVEGYGIPDRLELGTTDPSIPSQFQEDLCVGALHRIFSMEDVELMNEQQAQKHYMLWKQVIQDAQVALNTALRTQSRTMRLPRSFTHGSATQPEQAAQQQAAPQQGR